MRRGRAGGHETTVWPLTLWASPGLDSPGCCLSALHLLTSLPSPCPLLRLAGGSFSCWELLICSLHTSPMPPPSSQFQEELEEEEEEADPCRDPAAGAAAVGADGAAATQEVDGGKDAQQKLHFFPPLCRLLFLPSTSFFFHVAPTSPSLLSPLMKPVVAPPLQKE